MEPGDNPFPVDSDWYAKLDQAIRDAKRREEEMRKAMKIDQDLMRQPMTI